MPPEHTALADDAPLSASQKRHVALRLTVLNAIVLRMTTILGIQFNDSRNVNRELANRMYLGLIQLAESCAAPFPEMSAALKAFTAVYPNLYESEGEIGSVTRVVGPLKARVSEGLHRVKAHPALPLPTKWTELFADADASIGEWQRQKQQTQNRDADFEARVADLSAGPNMASAFSSPEPRLRIEESGAPPGMQTPTRWAAISGRWRLPADDEDGDRSLDYLGPDPHQSLPYGLAICDLSVTSGDIECEITFDWLEETAAGLIIGFHAAGAPYVIAELGAHESAFAISYYVPLADRWTSRPMTGSKDSLRPDKPYRIAVHVDGLRMSMSVDGVAIFDQLLEQPPMGTRIGAYAWGKRGGVHFNRVAVLDGRAVAGYEELPVRHRRGGRPSGRSFGFLLDCWFTCHDFGDRFDAPRQAYDVVESLVQAGRITDVDAPVRPNYPAARSYAAARRRATGKCLWYRHDEPLPSE